jgi:MFS family permease
MGGMDDEGGGWEAGSGGGGGGRVDHVVRLLKVLLMVAIYIARTTLMNCTYPLEEAILMDYVPKATRARWKSLDSIMVFGWCGSAAIGGIIADKYDYSATFLVTAALQALGTLVFAYLYFVIPRHQDIEGTSQHDEPSHQRTTPRETASSDVLVEPLVAGSIQHGQEARGAASMRELDLHRSGAGARSAG